MGTTAYLLDTFEGFNPADLKGVDAQHAMEFSDTSLESVRALVGEDSVRYIKGYFPESASQIPDSLNFAFVHIDCDLYTPIVNALNYFYPRLVPGGYLIVHDYFSLAWDGAEKAVDEFFADKPEPVIPLTDGCGSAVIRKARVPGRDGNWMTQKKRALFSSAWTSAGRGGLRPLLGDGWSVDEAWGVWGIGRSHVLNLVFAEAPDRDLVVEIDAAAAIVSTRPQQDIDVWAGGQQLRTMTFTMARNRAQHNIRMPVSAMSLDAWGHPTFRLEFRPRSVLPVNELNPANQDTRSLGLGLFGIRRAE
jgi:hypothetical protein